MIIVGLRHNDFDTYDPEEYDHNDPDYLDVTANEIGKHISKSQRNSSNSNMFSEAENEAFKSSERKIPKGIIKSIINTEVIVPGISRQPKSIDPDFNNKLNKGNNAKFNMRQGNRNPEQSHRSLAVQEWLKRGKKLIVF